MNSILSKEVLQDLESRTEKIKKKTPANWGKMNAAQMFQHLNKSLEIIFTEKPIKRMFIGRIIGKKILKKALSSDVLAKNTPTAPSFVAENIVDFEKERELWKSYLTKFSTMKESDMEGKVHPFFGKMTGNEWNSLIYKHINHHLKQFQVK